MRRRSAFTPTMPTALAIVLVLSAIESRAAGDPGRIAFDLALLRMGRDARAAGGATAVERLAHEVAAADPNLAAARSVTLQAIWAEFSVASACAA